jgi:hypothetical protein
MHSIHHSRTMAGQGNDGSKSSAARWQKFAEIGILRKMPAPRDVEPTWIPADQNPFYLRIMDCRPFTQTATSATADPELARLFVISRRADGSRRRGNMPPNASTAPCNLTYKLNVELHEEAVFRTREMEEKWDIDYFDEKLYFSRSWTGDLVFVATVAREAGVFTISAVNSEMKRQDESLMVIRDVDFLVKTYVFGREVPHSIPRELPSLERAILTYSFSVFGRAASFASYEDTILVAL